MLDMVAFYGARAGTVALLNVAGLADQHVTVQGNNVLVPTQCSKILSAYGMSQATAGSLTTQMVLSSPSLRATTLLELCNFNANGAVSAAAQIPDNNAPYNDFKESPIDLVPGEAMSMLTAVDAAAVAENVFGLVFLTDGVLACPFSGRIETVIYDNNAAAVINTWSPTAVTARQALRYGTYAVVGMKASGVSMVAARLVFGNQGARPGVIATNSPTGATNVGSMSDSVDQMNGLFRYGRLGLWGTFQSTNPPQIEMINSVADPANSCHFALDVIKIA
jgi:hypothetical protein